MGRVGHVRIVLGLLVVGCGAASQLDGNRDCPAGDIPGCDAADDVTSANDGVVAATDGDAMLATGQTRPLPHDVVDAKFSQSLSSIVMVSASPSSALYLYNVTAQTETMLALPEVPTAVDVDVTGMIAAVAYDAHVSWIDLASPSIKVTCPVSLSYDTSDVALSTVGVAYIMPAPEYQLTLFPIVDLTTCTATLTNGRVYAGGHVAMHPSQQFVFENDDGVGLQRCFTTKTPFGCVDALSPTSTYGGICTWFLWISSDGRRLYTGCGDVFGLPTPADSSVSSDLGSLAGETELQALAEAPVAGNVVVIPASSIEDPNADTVVHIHALSDWSLTASLPLPAFGMTQAHGLYVFTTPSMAQLWVIAEASNVFGVVTIAM